MATATNKAAPAAAPAPAPAAKAPAYMPLATYNGGNVAPFITGASVLCITAKGQRYMPRNSLQGNALSWQAVTAWQAQQGTPTFTFAKLQAHLTSTRNHGNYVRYCLRQGWLGVVAVNNPAYNGPFATAA